MHQLRPKSFCSHECTKLLTRRLEAGSSVKSISFFSFRLAKIQSTREICPPAARS